MMKWIVVAGFLIFTGLIVYWTIAPVQTSCEVCLEFDGELVCRRGAGETEEEALRAAQESACGGNVRGMSELIVCRGMPPVSSSCSTQ